MNKGRTLQQGLEGGAVAMMDDPEPADPHAGLVRG